MLLHVAAHAALFFDASHSLVLDYESSFREN